MMKKSLVSVVLGLTLLPMSATLAQDKFTLVSADRVSVYEEKCVFTMGKELTTGEIDRLDSHKCHGLKLENAKIQMENGEIVDVDTLEIGNFQRKITGNVKPEKKECMEKYAEKLEDLLVPSHERSPDDEELVLPESFTIYKNDDGKMRAISSHRDIELESGNEFFNHLAQATNILVNKSHEIAGSRSGFAIKKGAKVKCWSTAITSEVKVNDEKYNAELTGNIVNDSRNYFRNIFLQGREKTGEIINNVTSR